MSTTTKAVSMTWHGKKIYDRYRKDANRAVRLATSYLNRQLQENVSVPGKATGHPYAVARRGGSYNAPEPWMVHKPGSGLMLRPVIVKDSGEMITGIAGLHSTMVTRAIVYGTSKMRPRSVVWKTLGKHRGEVQAILRKVLKGKGHAR